jgi:hypothetical protein
LNKKKIGKIGLMEMLMLKPSLLFMGNGARICEEWQKNKVKVGNPKPIKHS